jgi:hypothetical protein
MSRLLFNFRSLVLDWFCFLQHCTICTFCFLLTYSSQILLSILEGPAKPDFPLPEGWKKTLGFQGKWSDSNKVEIDQRKLDHHQLFYTVIHQRSTGIDLLCSINLSIVPCIVKVVPSSLK